MLHSFLILMMLLFLLSVLLVNFFLRSYLFLPFTDACVDPFTPVHGIGVTFGGWGTFPNFRFGGWLWLLLRFGFRRRWCTNFFLLKVELEQQLKEIQDYFEEGFLIILC